MTEAPLRLLFVEDDEADARLTETLLADVARGRFAITRVERLAEALRFLQAARFDLVLCDLGLPDSSGLDTAQAVRAQAPELPLVVLTGSHDANLGPESIHQGAQDYLVKGECSGELMARSLRYAFERKRLEMDLRAANKTLEQRVAERVRELDRAHARLLESLARHQAITQTAVDAIITAGEPGVILSWNPAAERVFGYTEAEALGLSIELLVPQRLREAHLDAVRRVLAGADRHLLGTTVEVIGLTRNGQELTLELSLAQWNTAAGRFFTGIVRDLTERRRAAEEKGRQLEELQRWQALMLGREERVQELKREVNELCRRVGEPVRYSSEEGGAGDGIADRSPGKD